MGWKSKTRIVVIGIVVSIAGAMLVQLQRSERRNDLAHANSSCIANLKQIQGAIETYALEMKLEATNRIATSDISGSADKFIRPLINVGMVCPQGGTYSITTVGEAPRCTVAHHALQ